MTSPNFGTWPPGAISGWCIIDGASGAVVKQSGGIFGTFSHVGTGHCRVTLTMRGAESDDNIAVQVTSNDDGGSAASTRIASYGITAGVPAQLDIYTRDAAGALADADRLSVLVLGAP